MLIDKRVLERAASREARNVFGSLDRLFLPSFLLLSSFRLLLVDGVLEIDLCRLHLVGGDRQNVVGCIVNPPTCMICAERSIVEFISARERLNVSLIRFEGELRKSVGRVLVEEIIFVGCRCRSFFVARIIFFFSSFFMILVNVGRNRVAIRLFVLTFLRQIYALCRDIYESVLKLLK